MLLISKCLRRNDKFFLRGRFTIFTNLIGVNSVLYISTSVLVLHSPNIGCNLLFELFAYLCKFEMQKCDFFFVVLFITYFRLDTRCMDNRAYFALYPGGTSSLEQTSVPLAAYTLRTVYLSIESA